MKKPPVRANGPSGGLRILFEDEAIVVVDKPAGRIVHPAPGHAEGALTDELVATRPHMRAVGSVERPGVVHRLDIGTSGVMVFAKTDAAYRELRRQFEEHTEVKKTYLAVLHGAPRPAAGTIDRSVGRDPRRAVSHYRTLGKSGGLALVQFDIATGRLHQIRLHAAALGHPVVGDTDHGDARKDRALARPPARQLLHAARLSFLHPTTKRRVTFSADVPADLVFAG